MTQQALVRPFRELQLADQLGFNPKRLLGRDVACPPPWDVAWNFGKRTDLGAQRLELPAKHLQQLGVEAGAYFTRMVQPPPFVVTDQKSAEVLATSARFG